MDLVARRPLGVFCGLFLFGMVGGAYLLPVSKLALLGLLLLVTLALCGVGILRNGRAGNRMAYALFACLFLLAGLAESYLWQDVRLARAQEVVGEDCTVDAVVLERSGSSAYLSSYRIWVREMNGERAGYSASLHCAYPSDLQPGYSFVLTARGEAFDPVYRSYYLSEGVLLCLDSEEDTLTITGEQVYAPGLLLRQLRNAAGNWLEEIVGSVSDGDGSAFAQALFLGLRDALPDDLERDFRRSGIIHLLAISGLHMTFLIGGLETIFRKLGMPRLLRSILLPGLTLSYLALTGFSLSAIRSACMLTAVYAAYWFGWQRDSLTALLGAGAFCPVRCTTPAFGCPFRRPLVCCSTR